MPRARSLSSATIVEESRPPLRRTPTGTSLISLDSIDASSFSRTAPTASSKGTSRRSRVPTSDQ